MIIKERVLHEIIRAFPDLGREAKGADCRPAGSRLSGCPLFLMCMRWALFSFGDLMPPLFESELTTSSIGFQTRPEELTFEQ